MRCLNRKVLAAVGVLALAVWLLAPNLVGAALPLLFLAVCPLSMVAMMWAMGRARPSSGAHQESDRASADER